MDPSSGTRLASRTGAIGVGTVLAGRYRLQARAGAGGMATIFRAHDGSLERDVAVKVLHAHLAEDPALLARFTAEARAAASLLHPNIVNVFDQGLADLPYIVMELIDGPSLREVLGRRGRLPAGEALAVVEPICHALGRAHDAGVVHRDIKPENVLLAPDGTPKVVDFGIARVASATSHTATGTLVGSVHYLAPELVDGREATARSDQYAVGVVLFELLTGDKPLPADTPMAVALRHATEAVPVPSSVVPEVSPALDEVVARATAIDPAVRYPNLPALAAALRHAVPAGPAPVSVPGVDRDGNGTLVIPAEPGTRNEGARASWPAARPRVPRRPRPRRRWALWGLLALFVAGVVAAACWNFLLVPVTTVPRLVGQDRQVAAAVLGDLGLGYRTAKQQHRVDETAGTVLSQRPPAGAKLRRGQPVALTLSLGPADVPVPTVEGAPLKRARKKLAAAPNHFDVTVRDAFSRTAPAGEVLAVRPAEGTRIPQGREVTLTVSKGIEQVAVPKVVGDAREDAEAALADRGLAVEISEQYSDEAPKPGMVIASDVRGGKRIDKGSTVGLTVSLGPLTVSLPGLVGTDVGDAVAELEGLALDVSVTEQPRPWIGPLRRGSYGRVEAQVPDAGTTLQRGDRVDLYTFSAAAEEAED